ncbi:hypothetical protein [Curtobacterium sp. Leaf261]|jgi:hypothetical protein|uniref:hypothetical protein n=1 Tax=Curtobacterium sp. Leaf261 TaxID=1736311 RepID=UPI0012E27BC5|nr:hypothetical protein [Curtobacterium sp. Leaf261]
MRPQSGRGPRCLPLASSKVLEFHVFDVFVVVGVLALFGLVALIGRGVERL